MLLNDVKRRVVSAGSFSSSFQDKPLERGPVDCPGEDMGALVQVASMRLALMLGPSFSRRLQRVDGELQEVGGYLHRDGGLHQAMRDRGGAVAHDGRVLYLEGAASRHLITAPAARPVKTPRQRRNERWTSSRS